MNEVAPAAAEPQEDYELPLAGFKARRKKSTASGLNKSINAVAQTPAN